MAKSNKTDDARYHELRGTRYGKSYKAWLNVVEISGTTGRSHRVLGIFSNRKHELFSDLEEYYFLLTQWNDDVLDVREQFPLLPIEQTELIAEEQNIRHPCILKKKRVIPGCKSSHYVYVNENIVMTTDFLITLRNGTNIARSIKSSTDLNNKRVVEKLFIEEQYWKMKGIEWKIVTDESIPRDMALNIKLLMGACLWYRSSEVNEDQLMAIKRALIQTEGEENDYIEICKQIDIDMRLPRGHALSSMKFLMWTKDIAVDIRNRLDFRNIKIERAGCRHDENINFKRCCRRCID
jgi:hypothetical protein